MATICSTANLFFFMAKPSLSRSRFCRKLTLILDQKIEVPSIAVGAFRHQLALAGPSDWLFPSSRTPGQHYKSAKGIWRAALRKAGISYFRIYDLRSTYATRLSAGGVADEWVIQLLRQGNSDVFKKYSQIKLTMKREALQKTTRRANEMTIDEAPAAPVYGGFGTVLVQ